VEREQYWLDPNTNQKFSEVALNPDAYAKQVSAEDQPMVETHPRSGVENRTEDQEEVYRASLKLTDEVIP